MHLQHHPDFEAELRLLPHFTNVNDSLNPVNRFIGNHLLSSFHSPAFRGVPRPACLICCLPLPICFAQQALIYSKRLRVLCQPVQTTDESTLLFFFCSYRQGYGALLRTLDPLLGPSLCLTTSNGGFSSLNRPLGRCSTSQSLLVLAIACVQYMYSTLSLRSSTLTLPSTVVTRHCVLLMNLWTPPN